MIETFFVAWLVLLAGGALLWAWSLRSRDVSIVDVFWGPAFIVAVWLYLTSSGGPRWEAANLALLATVTLWGLRLAPSTSRCRRRGHGEDRPATAKCASAPAPAIRATPASVTVFGLPGDPPRRPSSAPFLLTLAQGDPGGLGPAADPAGLAVWAIGFLFEATADAPAARLPAQTLATAAG